MFCSRVLQRPRSIFPPPPSRPPFSPPQKSFYRFLRDQIITRWCKKKEKKEKSSPTSLPPSPSFFLFFSVICVHVVSMKRTLRNVSRRREDVVHGTRGKRKENSTRETCARAAWEKEKKKEERKKEKKGKKEKYALEEKRWRIGEERRPYKFPPMLAGHLSTETRFTEGFVCTQKLVEGRPLARRRKRAEIRAQEDARDVTGSDNAPPRIACTHTHNGLPRIQDAGDDAIPSACPRAPPPLKWLV